MAGNNIQYTIGFNANTSQAKSELASLQNTLRQISNMSIDLIDNDDIQDIQSASAAARELGSALSEATNKSTGKLDLSLFQKSIARSGHDLNDLISRLSLAGNTGSKAFQQLASSITNAHMPIKQTSKLLTNFATTMKNTIKWQLSSNLVHGLQSGLQGAISYAKNLNSSLTDIRIVTGASADEMARFAKQANNAAKQLSTSTLDYTKASLIYYQQGDSEAEAKRKAEITLKAANASFNTSTQEMSEYLTAVWNSYQVGADELERYVDIMAALGAKTATSLEEIATSMQKVAATGNTVGVSMEQVSSIIATVSSVTRESAESIGTSYKTIFARMGDLKLGKTDEDGIGLGQVSSSLEKIGVSVLTASGDLRKMGDIITDLGNKWQTMTNAEKTAIAQVVAGKRQYTQLMALFENWDMYNQNLEIAGDSEGALQEMQDIYAESWEAASKRVKASLESVYSSILNDQVIINITNGIADLIDKVHSLVDAFGGVESVLGILGTVFMKHMKPQIAQGIGNLVNNLKISTGVAQKEFVQNQKNIMDEMQSSASLTSADQRVLGYYDKLREAQKQVVLSGKTFTQEQINQIESTIAKLRERINVEIQLIELQKQRSQASYVSTSNLANEFVRSVAEDGIKDGRTWDQLAYSEQQRRLTEVRAAGPDSDAHFINNRLPEIENLKNSLKELQQTDIKLNIELETEDKIVKLKDLADNGIQCADNITNAFRMANVAIGQTQAAQGQISNIQKKMPKLTAPEDIKAEAKNLIQTVNNLGLDEAIRNELLDGVQKALKAAEDGTEASIADLTQALQDGLTKVEAKVKEIQDAAGKVNDNARAALGDNVSQQSVDRTARDARREGAARQAAQPMSEDDFGKEAAKALQKAQQEAQNFATSLANVLQGVTSLTSGINILTNGLNGLATGSATLGESLVAITSGISMLAFGISSLVNNFKVLRQGYSSVNTLLTIWINKKKAAITNTAHLTAETLKYIVVQKREGKSIKEIIAGIMKKVAARKAETAALKEQTAAQNAANASQPLAWSFLAITAIITLTTAISSYIHKLKEARAEASETAKAQMESVKEKAEETNKESEAIVEAMGSYAALRKEYEETGEAKEEYKTATEAVLQALGLEGVNVDETAEKYKQLANIIDYANTKRLNQNLTEAQNDKENLKKARRTYIEGVDDQEGWDSDKTGWVKIDNAKMASEQYTFQWAQQNLWNDIKNSGYWTNQKAMLQEFKEYGFISKDVSQNDDFSISSDAESLLTAYYGMKEMQEKYAGIEQSAQWSSMFEIIENMALSEIAVRIQEAEASAMLEQEKLLSQEEWQAQAGNKNKTQNDYFAYVEDQIMQEFTNLGLDESTAQSSVDAIVQSWVSGLSLDDEFDDYKDIKEKQELYADDKYKDQRIAVDKTYNDYLEADKTLQLYKDARAALIANPHSEETRKLFESLGISTEVSPKQLSDLIAWQETNRSKAWTDYQGSQFSLGAQSRTELLKMTGLYGTPNATIYDNSLEGNIKLLNDTQTYLTTLEEGLKNVIDPNNKDHTKFLQSTDEDKRKVLTSGKDITYNSKDYQFYTGFEEAVSKLMTAYGLGQDFWKKTAEENNTTVSDLTLQQRYDALIAYSEQERAYWDHYGSQIFNDAETENMPISEKVNLGEKYGEVDIEKTLADFVSYTSLQKQDDIWELSDSAFASFIERLGDDYIGKTKEDFAKMSTEEWNKMILDAGSELMPLMDALKENEYLTAEQIAQVVQASVDTANKAHEAAQSAWEKIISLTSEEQRSERAITEKQEANETAQKWLEQGGSYDTLDAWTKYWLQESGVTSNNFTQKALQDSQQALNIEREGLYSGIYTRGMTIMENAGEWDNILNGYRLNVQEDSEGKYRVVDGEGVIIESVELPADLIENLGLQTDIEGEGQFVIIDENMMNQLWSQTENASDQMHATEEFDMVNPSVLNERQTYDYLKGLDSQFSALDAFEADASTENLLALHDALDMTNDSIRQYYEALASAETAEEREYYIDRITEAILKQNDATLTGSEASEALLQSYYDSYGVMDDYGKSLTVAGVNALKVSKNYQKLTKEQLKIRKEFQKMNKTWKDNNKVVKMGNKEYDNMIDLYKDIAKQAKKTGKNIEDVVDDIEGLTNDEKKMLKQASKEYKNIFDTLQKDLGGTFEQLPEDLQTSIQNCDLDGLISNLINPMSFDTLFGNVDTASAKFQAAIANMANSSDAAIRAMGEQLKVAAESNGQINLGTIINGLGVDLSNPIEVLNALVKLFSYLAGIPYLSGAAAALGPLSSALSQAQNVQNTYGGGGGVQNANTPSSGRGGGGGGQKEKKDYKRFKDENERYHVQNETLDRIGEQLDKIDKLKDAAYGADHLAQLDAETKALKEQYDAQVDLYNEAMKYQAADRSDLISLNVGVQFDENGTISNYEEVIQKLVDRYNAAVDKYNNSEQEDGDKLRLEDAEEAYEDAMTAIENYEEAVATANEAQNEMLDILNQLSEIELEKITYELELNLEINEKDIELLEYFQSKYEDTLHAQDELFGSLMESAAQYEDNLSAIDRAYRDLLGAYTSGTINEADYAEGLKELSDQMIENLNNLQDVADEIAETYTDTLELAREEVDKTAATLEHFNSVMESYINIAGLSGKTFFGSDGEEVINSYKGLDAFYDAQYKNNLNRILIHREHLNVLTEEEDRFRDKIEAGQQLTELEKQQYAALQEQIQETREQVLSATEETLETLQAGYENTINGIAQDLDEFMAGAAGSIAHLADQYAYFQEEQERYVSTAKELYEVSQLTRDIENSISEASTKASKEALKALQEKINKQSELNELTEYDIEMNQLQYQLLLARIQLEEAQNAKDTVRLTRDDNGNYAYQYTADQGKVDEAVQHYEDVLQQINDLTTQRTSEIEQQMIDAMQSYKDQFQEIALDQTLTAEQRNERLAELNNRFSETMLYLQEQNGIVTENLTLNQEAIAEHYGVSMADITASTAGNVNETIQSMIDKTQEYINAMNQAIYGEDGANSAWKEYAERMGIVNNASGTAYEDMLNNTEELGEMNKYATEEALNTLQTLEETIKPLGNLTEAWDAHNAVLENTITYYEQLANNIHKVMSIIGETGTSGGITTGITSFMPNQSAINNYEEIIAAEQLNQALHGNDQKLEEMHQNELTSGGGGGNSKNKYAQSGFNYDAITDYVDAMTYQTLLSQLFAQGLDNMSAQEIVQQITIEAEFPNVTDQYEIMAAFDTMANNAAQFASRKN